MGGDPLPYLRVIQQRLLPKLSNRSLIQILEPMIKMLTLAWHSHRELQSIFSQLEYIGGYSDLILFPTPAYP